MRASRTSGKPIKREPAMLENIGTSELLVVGFIVFLFFGPKKFPEMGKNLGKGIREFRNAFKGVQEGIQDAMKIDQQ
jgi:sec-independent protein translocase protein TatA